MSKYELGVWGYDNKVRQNEQSEAIFHRNMGFARQLARLVNARYEGTVQKSEVNKVNLTQQGSQKKFWYPFGTLTVEEALKLGAITEEHAKLIQSESISPSKAKEVWKNHQQAPRFIGGVASSLVESKAIVHTLISPDASRPEIWTPEINKTAEALQQNTLFGFTGFNPQDLREGTDSVLNEYKSAVARLKSAKGSGGEGQATVNNTGSSFNESLNKIQSQLQKQGLDLSQVGAVVELQLKDPYAFSFGQLFLKGRLISFVGVIYDLEINGASQFLGSNKYFYPGDWDDLLNHIALPLNMREALHQVKKYESDLMKTKGILALRTNYNWIVGPLDAPDMTNPPTFSKATEHTLRGGGSSLLELLEWDHSKKYPNMPTCGSSRQIFSLEDQIIRLKPLAQMPDRVVYAYKKPQQERPASSPTLESVYATLHTPHPAEFENEEKIKEVLFSPRDDLIVFENRKKKKRH
jgi:hypothetical protein